jgi:hypothetical protein
MRQKQLFLGMEADFGLVKPIFLNTPYGWYDTKLVHAHDLTSLSIGRYRVDLETNVKGVQEFWFDFEWTRYDEAGAPILLVGRELVGERFLRLRAVLEVFSPFLAKVVDLRRVYVRASGTGFHVFFFVQGIAKEQWLELTRRLLKDSAVVNTKGAARLVYGVDFDSVISTRKKLRETFSPNFDKSRVKRDVGFENYSSTFLLPDFLKLGEYPFASSLDGVVSPERYVLAALKKAALGRHKTLAGQVRECPALMRILQEPSTRCWQARNFLVKDLQYLFKMTEKQINDFISKENHWDDYNEDITRMYVNRHFTEGRNESLVKKPIKRSTLMRYGYCKNDCRECVYNKY